METDHTNHVVVTKHPIATAMTNKTIGSVVHVKVEDLICSLTVLPNVFGDTLPIIPKESRTVDNKVLYQLELKAKLIKHADGKPESGHPLHFRSNRTNDKITSGATTDANGELLLTLETREQGPLELNTTTAGVTLPVFKLNLKEAWYEAGFEMTNYIVCDENDF